MAGTTTKKAVIRRFDREPIAGYLNPLSFVRPEGVELLSATGNVIRVSGEEIKMICFVRDLETTGEVGRLLFQTRPKMEGLWVRFQFRDGEVMEGVLPNNLLQMETHGFTAIPPDSYSNNQRIFVPKTAVTSVKVLGVVGSPLKKRKPKAPPKDQIGLFEE